MNLPRLACLFGLHAYDPFDVDRQARRAGRVGVDVSRVRFPVICGTCGRTIFVKAGGKRP